MSVKNTKKEEYFYFKWEKGKLNEKKCYIINKILEMENKDIAFVEAIEKIVKYS